MPLPLVRYPLDRTGRNPDNLVKDELHTLNAKPNRIIVPTHGPFYTEGLKLIDKTTTTALVRDVDYKCVEILQEATLKYGKEICQVVLVTNPDISSEVLMTYQVLGGLYSFDMSAIVDMYETANLDQRPVDWLNVLNKPMGFPPTLHNHVLEDVYGFEYLVVALERIRNAIVLTDVPAFEAVIDYVKSRTLDVVSYQEIDERKPVNKYVTFEKLLYYVDSLDVCTIQLMLKPDRQRIDVGQILYVKVETSCLPKDITYHWVIEHITTTPSDFAMNPVSGRIDMQGRYGVFEVPISRTAVAKHMEHSFKIKILRNSLLGRMVAISEVITITNEELSILDYMHACCLYNPDTHISPTAMYFLED